MKHKYLLLCLALFFFLILFSATSLALIPGDFGSANNGPPDGVVDFEDLMIFAMAYGSTPADDNWNEVCDIAGQGSPTPDGVIDFEDLMIFAMNYGRRDIVSNIDVITITYQSSMSKLADTITELEEEGKLPPTYYLNEPQEPAKGVTGYAIHVGWHSYYGATGYRVYRSVNGGSSSMVLDETASGYTWYGFWDDDVSPGNTYSYYVTAYGDFGETNPSETVTRKTFLPPCSLDSPPDGSIVSESTPTFTWNPAGVSTFPYDSTIYSGETYLRVYDVNTYDTFWRIWFEDMTTSTATYNQDGYATPLVSDSTYKWYVCSHGYGESGNLIAVSQSEYWYFGYGDPVVFNVGAYTITYQSSMSKLADTITELEEEGKLPVSYKLNEPKEPAKGVTGYEICVDWHSYYGATGYRVYRKVNGGSYSMVLDEPASGYTYYGFWDDDVSSGSTYSYYVTAYGDFGETNPSQTVTRDTFLPPCSLVSPTDESIITNPTPTFTWNPVGLTPADFPYGSIYSGQSDLDVWDQSTGYHAWWIGFDDLITSTVIYNQDNIGEPLQISQGYSWNIDSYGFDDSGDCIAYSWSENWDFVYSGGALAGITKVVATAQTYYSSTMSKYFLIESEESWPGQGYFFNKPELLEKAELNHSISLSWSAYCETTGCAYRVYRKINEGEYEIFFSQEAPTGYDWYGWVDNEAGSGNTYSYYVTAYGPDWETDPSEIVTIDTWLPPCTLNSPPDGSLISNPNPEFDWDPVITDFPYGSLVSGRTCMLVYDDTISDFTWIVCTGDPNISTATYNQDGGALSLVNGHNYSWHCWNSGYDENWNRIAVSESIDWHFDYTGP